MSSVKPLDVKISDKDVENIVSQAYGPRAKAVDYELKPYSERRIGILARHSVLKVKVRAADSEESTDRTFFVKSANRDDSLTSTLDDCYFPEEVHFFAKVIPELLESGGASEPYAPWCYLARRDLLVFEDLRSAGYANVRRDFLDGDELKRALSAVARFHGSSLLAERSLGRPLDQLYSEDFFREKQFFPPGSPAMRAFNRQVRVTLKTACELAGYFGLPAVIDADRAQAKLHAAVTAAGSGLNVLCHGDVYKNNFMFHGSDARKCVLVDYQFLRYASPGTDVAMLLYVNSSRQSRGGGFEREMLEHYYEALCDTLGGLGAPGFGELLEAYEAQRLVGSFYALMSLPSLLLPRELAEELVNDHRRMKRYFLDDRMDVIVPVMERDEEYRRKIREIVEEFAEQAKDV